MTYELLFTEIARRKLKKLDAGVQGRITAALERIRFRPEQYVKKLVGIPYYSLRTGEYRIILDIQHEKLIIMVITLGHRKNVYKNL